MTAAADDPFLGAAEDDLFFLEHCRVKRHLVPSSSAVSGVNSRTAIVAHPTTLYEPAFLGKGPVPIERRRPKAPPQLSGSVGIL
jgi:hypothetical protein